MESTANQEPLPAASAARLHWCWTFVAFAALAAAVYLPAAWSAGFLGFDDPFFFGPDDAVMQRGLLAVLREPIANAYLPVAHASLWLDRVVGGGAPFWPHLHAILLHAAVAAVLARLLLALRWSTAAAHLAAALFLLHPALAESVAWVASRKDLMSGLFVALALLACVRLAGGGAAAGRSPAAASWLPAALVLLFGALAMYSKATAVVQPLLALLVCACLPPGRRRWLGPLLLLLVTVPIAWQHQAIAAAEGTLQPGSLADRLPQVPAAFGHYFATACWPSGLNVLYPEQQTLARFAAGEPRLLVAALLLLLALLATTAAARTRPIAVGLAAFLVALLPFNTAWPASSIAAADRYLYLALPGLAVAVVAAARLVAGRHWPWLALLLLPLAWASGSRAFTFRNDEVLWSSSLAVAPANAVARYNLVAHRLARGMPLADARQELAQVVADAGYPIQELRAQTVLVTLALRAADYPAAAAHARAAVAAAERQLLLEVSASRRQQAAEQLLLAQLQAFQPLQLAGDAAGAAALCEQVAVAQPEHPQVVAFQALRRLQQLAAERGTAAGPLPAEDPDAAHHLQRLAAALAQHADHAGLLVAQAAWEQYCGRALAAVRSYQLAQRADPRHVDAWLGAARLLRERECYEDAARYAGQGFRQVPDPALLQEQALAMVGLGQLDDAIANLEAFLRVRPQDQDTPKVLSNLLVGRAYARLADKNTSPADIRRMVERALSYNPAEPRAQLVLGRLARDQRQFAVAVQHLELAVRGMPDFAEAVRLLAECLQQLGMQQVLAKDDEAAAAAFLRCREVAPPDFDRGGLTLQLQRLWRAFEQRGLERRKAGDRAGAVADFQRCLQIDPEQHWAAWLLASTLADAADADLVELERLARLALAFHQQHQLERSQPVWLLANTLLRRGETAAARQLAEDYLAQPDPAARPQVLAALRRLRGD